jgi:O-antigen/teichoic acid export membrane protein
MIRRPTGKFSADVGFNAGAFAVSAVLGVLVNLLIVREQGASSLGVFNQIYAVYILLSQLAVGGVHLGVQALVPKDLAEAKPVHASVTAALLISTLTSLGVMALAWVFRAAPGTWFGSEDVVIGFASVIPGLIFFSWNKVLLSFHNGARRMKLFALFQLLRFAFLLGFVALLVDDGARPHELPVALAWTEMVLFALLLPLSLRWWNPLKSEDLRGSLRVMFRFGNKALTGNLLLDLNTRVDVFILGLFTSDAVVGLFSFAATVAEGVMQLPLLLRNNINPVLSKAWHSGKAPLVGTVVRRNRKAFLKLLAPVVLLSIVLFPVGLWILGMEEEPRTVWAVYSILALGIAVTAGHQPFQMLFSQLGRPGTQTLFIAGVFLSNVLLNLLFIPLMGVYGAALGTSLSLVAMAFLLDRLARRTFGIRI